MLLAIILLLELVFLISCAGLPSELPSSPTPSPGAPTPPAPVPPTPQLPVPAPPAPVLPLGVTTSTLPAGTSGSPYAATLSASGGAAPYTWSITAGALPPGLLLGAGSGAISGTPSATGSFGFTAQVTDSANHTATADLSINIGAAVQPLTILTSKLADGTVQIPYSAPLTAEGGVPPYDWVLASGTLPPGLRLDNEGVIRGTPTAAGSFAFTAQVTDTNAQSARAALSITINVPPPLGILTSSLPAGTSGVAYSATLSASGGVTPYTWSISAGTLPGGLSLNSSSGKISGTPVATGTFDFTVQVSDVAAQRQTAALSITINAPPPLSLLTTSLPGGTVGTAYSATLSAFGGVTPYTWSISAGALPGGLSLSSSSGNISGTPTVSGTFNFTAQVTDSAAQSKNAALSITIVVPALTVTTGSLPNGIIDKAYSATLAATGGGTPYTWTITAGTLPPGLTLNGATGGISGTPTATGTSNFTAQVTDAASHTQSAALSITIDPPPTNDIRHVVIVVEENKSFGEVIGNTGDMPFVNSLANTYGLATNYFANILSSQGDYFMLTVGQILTTDSSFTGVFSGDNIVRHLNDAGLRWKVYAESIPSVGYTGGDQFPYIKIHNPFAYISDVLNGQADHMVPFAQLADDLANGNLPDYAFVIPNTINDGHDCAPGRNCSLASQLSTTDGWLNNNIGPLLADPGFRQHGLLLITWDESDGDGTNGGGRVATLVIGAKVKPGFRSGTFFQHQSLLKLSMQALGLTSFPGAAAGAPDMIEFFTGPLP